MAAKSKVRSKVKVAKKKTAPKIAAKKVKAAKGAKVIAKSAKAIAKPAKPAAAKRAASKPAAKIQTVPAGYQTITPMLTLADAAGAIAFYKDALGAQERFRMPGPDGKIMHAEIQVGNSVVMISDAIQSPETKSSLHVYVDDCDSLYDRAIAAGASAKMPLQDMFWGDRFGSVTDPFGNTWSIATHKEDVSPDEMAKRMAAAGPPPPPEPSA